MKVRCPYCKDPHDLEIPKDFSINLQAMHCDGAGLPFDLFVDSEGNWEAIDQNDERYSQSWDPINLRWVPGDQRLGPCVHQTDEPCPVYYPQSCADLRDVKSAIGPHQIRLRYDGLIREVLEAE